METVRDFKNGILSNEAILKNEICLNNLQVALLVGNQQIIRELLGMNISLKNLRLDDLTPYISLDEIMNYYEPFIGINVYYLLIFVIEAQRYDLFEKLKTRAPKPFTEFISRNVYEESDEIKQKFFQMIFEFSPEEENQEIITNTFNFFDIRAMDLIINMVPILSLQDKLALLTNFILHLTKVIGLESHEISCDDIIYYIDKMNLDRDETMNYLQGLMPTPICNTITTYVSGRGKIIPTQIRALGELTYQKRNINIPVLRDFLQSDKCFCLNVEPGIYKNVYIPIIRYGKSPEHGYYGGFKITSHDFTWFYIEPESGIYLYTPKALITKNKITAVVELLYMSGVTDIANEPTIGHRIKYLFGDYVGPFDALLRKLIDPHLMILHRKLDNFLMTNGKNVEFPGGFLDFLDEHITRLAKQNNIDTVVLTHQPGSEERLVSECVDTRPREVTLKNLYQD